MTIQMSLDESGLRATRSRVRGWRPAGGVWIASAVKLRGDAGTLLDDASPWVVGSANELRAVRLPSEPSLLGSVRRLSVGDAESARNFVERFGFISHPEPCARVEKVPGALGIRVGGRRLVGEPVWQCLALARYVNWAAGLWDALGELRRAQDADRNGTAPLRALVEYIEWSPGAIAYRVPKVSRLESYDEVVVRDRRLLRLLPKHDRARIAEFVLVHEINRALQGHAAVSVRWQPRPAVEFRSDCLIGTLWLRLAQEIGSRTSNPRKRVCACGCGRMVVGRPNKKYFEHGCANRIAYRRRIGQPEGGVA